MRLNLARRRWQKGGVRVRGGSVYAEYRESLPGNDGKRRRISKRLGSTGELSETEAREIVAALVRAENAKSPAIGTLTDGFRVTVPRRKRFVAPAIATGAICELLVGTDLLCRGFEVFRSLNPQGPTDLVCVYGASFMRVQVKAGELNGSGHPVCNYRRDLGKFNVLAVVSGEGSISYFGADGVTVFDPVTPKSERHSADGRISHHPPTENKGVNQ